MSKSIGTKFPEELLQAILIRLDDSRHGWRDKRMSKRGLTSCSLTCRYWARHVRPLLFTHLTLHSREDEAQLQAFLATPDFLGFSIGDSMCTLTLSYDGAASGIPWTVLRPAQSTLPSQVEVGVEWRMMGGSTQKGQTYLLSRVLPNILPPSAIHCIRRLTLCNLSIPIRDFLRFVRFIRFEQFDMENVTFDEGEDLILLETLPALLFRRNNSWPYKRSVYLRGLSRSSLLYWTTVGRLMLSEQVHRMNDTRVPASLSSRLSIVTDTYGTDNGAYNLVIVSTDPLYRRARLSYNFHYHLYNSRGILAAITEGTRRSPGAATLVPITFTQLCCPDLKDNLRGFATIDRLCQLLGDIETAVTGSIAFVCSSVEDRHTLACGIVEKRVLADPRDKYTHLQTQFWSNTGFAVYKILKVASADMALHDSTTLPLGPMQHMKGVYLPENSRMCWYYRWLWDDTESEG